jgi:hypothetical protein
MSAPETAAERRIQFRIASGRHALGRYRRRLGRGERDVQLAGTKKGFEGSTHFAFSSPFGGSICAVRTRIKGGRKLLQ